MQMEKSGDNPTLGIDIGGVVIKPMDRDKDTSFLGENYLKTPVMEGAFEAIRELAAAKFGGRVHLVSKCGPGVQSKTAAWLAHRRFFEETGVPRENLHFCLKRHEKAPICAALGITHFVDDRLEVLSHMTGVANLYLFRPRESEVERFAQHLGSVRRVESWDALRDDLLGLERAA